MKTFGVLVLLCVFATGALAAGLKVPGTYATIQAAVDAAVDGDVIKVSAGTYVENVSVNGKTGITIKRVGGGQVVVDAGGTGTPLTIEGGSTNILVSNLTLQNSADSSGVVIMFSSDIHLEGCKVLDVAFDGVGVLLTFNVWITNCSIKNVGLHGIELVTADCVISGNTIKNAVECGVLVVGERNTVDSNVIKSTGFAGIQLGDSPATCEDSLVLENTIRESLDGIYVDATAIDCSILDNTIKEPLSDGIEVQSLAVGHVIDGNTVKKPGDSGFELDALNLRVTRNKVKKSVDDGFFIQWNAAECLLYGNIAKKCADDGFQVDGTDNSLVGNTATGSGDFDLQDANPAGSNAYVDNTFGSIGP